MRYSIIDYAGAPCTIVDAAPGAAAEAIVRNPDAVRRFQSVRSKTICALRTREERHMSRKMALARALGCALLTGLCGCGSSAAPEVPLSDASSVPGLIPTAGTASIAGTLDQGGTQRSYIGVVPVKPQAGAPLLLMLHPLATSNVAMANLTRVGRLAASDGAVVVLPLGENGTWHDDPAVSGPDDVGFISALIDRIAQQYQTDPARVYVMGFSEGGFMTERLACELSQRLAAAGTVGSLLRNGLAAACAPARRISMALINGTADPINSFLGQPMIGTESAPASAAFWAQQEGCSGASPALSLLPLLVNDGTSIGLSDYGACPPGLGVDFFTVNGGGHTWPGSPFPSNYGATTQNLDATLQLWQFFQQPTKAITQPAR